MSRLPDRLNPPAIVETLTRYECPKCGNNCQCGVPYVPKTVRAAEAIKAAPDKSNRVIAAETGLSEPTVRRARASCDAPDTVTGRDGKTYPAGMRPDTSTISAETCQHPASLTPRKWKPKTRPQTARSPTSCRNFNSCRHHVSRTAACGGLWPATRDKIKNDQTTHCAAAMR
jgi:hypothetical protein